MTLLRAEYRNGEVFQGGLSCRQGHYFKVENFIPDFIDPADSVSSRSQVYDSLWQAHASQWYKGRMQEYTEKFQDFARLPGPFEYYFKDKVILDAGCGEGRFTYLASSCGAKHVIALDYSGKALARALAGTGNPENCSFARVNIQKLPLTAGFDYVFSLGVLHHTPDTRSSFFSLAKLLKPGSYITIYVYGKRTLPLIIWPIRMFSLKADKAKIIRFCNSFGFAYDPAVKAKFPLKKAFLALNKGDLLGISRITYEGLTTPYLREHSFQEAANWFKQSGISIVSSNPRLLSITGKLST